MKFTIKQPARFICIVVVATICGVISGWPLVGAFVFGAFIGSFTINGK